MYSRLQRCFSRSHCNLIKARVPNFPTVILSRQGYPTFPLQSYQGKGTQHSKCNLTKARYPTFPLQSYRGKVPNFPAEILPRQGYPTFPLQSYQCKGTQLSHCNLTKASVRNFPMRDANPNQRHNLASARTQSKNFMHQILYISKIDKFSFRPKMLNLLLTPDPDVDPDPDLSEPCLPCVASLTLCSCSVWPGLPWVAATHGQVYPVKQQYVTRLTCAAAVCAILTLCSCSMARLTLCSCSVARLTLCSCSVGPGLLCSCSAWPGLPCAAAVHGRAYCV